MIEFDVAGTIEAEYEPPAIAQPVTIDATTLPGYEGAPLVEVDGGETETEGPTGGIRAYGEGGQVRLEGLAVNGFERNVLISGEGGPSQICGNYIGTDLSGTESKPGPGNFIPGAGIEISMYASAGNQIGGAGCPGNVVSGNGEAGIVDEGDATAIEGNRIGTDPSGTLPVPNGAGSEGEGGEYEGGGIVVAPNAEGPRIGLFPDQGRDEGNTIAHNYGAGVLVEDGAAGASIFANSIFSNLGPGIEIAENAPQPPPEIEEVAAGGAETTVTGTLEGDPEAGYFVAFFANAECDPSGSGEGERYIGSSSSEAPIETDGAGVAHFEVSSLDPLPEGERVVTASDESEGGEALHDGTSEFSECVTASEEEAEEEENEEEEEAEESEEEEEAEAGSRAIVPAPMNGKSVVVAPKSGKVFITLPGTRKRRLLKEGEAIPVGSIVDATHGKVTLTSVNARGETQTATFFGGKFLVLQHGGSGLVILRLRGDHSKRCRRGHRRRVSHRASASRRAYRRGGRKGRHLWGSGKGNFRTEGNYGSATVRGTIWLTEDRCGGTFFKVRRGVVSVRDFPHHRTISLPKGKSYLAHP